ncbi:MAG: MBL fold metallo-hydrolase [Gammaproteobacteria bacterium]|nr:MBL fold metallo-hydrolase [Gammaproteobacteria bacterium]
MSVEIKEFFDSQTATFTYLVIEEATKKAVVIDPVLDYEPHSGMLTTLLADQVLAAANEQGATIERVLETHAHADHLSAAAYIKGLSSARVGIGAGIVKVQQVFQQVFNLGESFAADGSQFDDLFDDGETIGFGDTSIKVMHTPGHTNDGVTYLIDDCAFVGDTLFAPDYGSARCDFPGGDAGLLYDSIQKLYCLPEETRLCLCHDYPPSGRGPTTFVTVEEQKQSNVHIKHDTARNVFIAMREDRDRGLGMPKLLLPAVQVNISAGEPPIPEANGVAYLKVPINFDFAGLAKQAVQAA